MKSLSNSYFSEASLDEALVFEGDALDVYLNTVNSCDVETLEIEVGE